MTKHENIAELEVGYDIPAAIGMAEERHPDPLPDPRPRRAGAQHQEDGRLRQAHGMRHRVHGKMHKSVDVQSCRRSSAARSASAARRSARPRSSPAAASRTSWSRTRSATRRRSTASPGCRSSGARTIVCVDDIANVADLSAAAQKHGTTLECLVEIDCGAGRCGVTTTQAVVEIAKAIAAAPGLKFTGIQAYQGAMQHLDKYEDRKAKIDAAIAMVKDAVAALKAEGLEPELVCGGGTGSYYFESNSGVYNELQCGSYAFMDADYGRILDKDGKRIDQGEWENALFILTSVMSHAKPDKAICDAGLKAQSVDSRPAVHLRPRRREIRQMLRRARRHRGPERRAEGQREAALVPGHCDPTCNVHDWYVGVRNGKVETLWPVSARGKAY